MFPQIYKKKLRTLNIKKKNIVLKLDYHQDIHHLNHPE